ncbi:hypothetical protein Poli38472_009394 [Pythium oligandrum]|uniref:Uncharacterized protein n=1 Tax=Pythium oligandrum TaxID=41045 RepID=A0A8K1CKN2_PYTOL|nr:hypothetical protein Poli38472_009394 [Pythium oligandrum]|eukprot:TMW65227.1 hypothetical protein Poli38472_009394 [Pythium oligandrum]
MAAVSMRPHQERALEETRMSASASGSASGAVERSTCTWTQKEVQGQCVLKPRSCYDCLNTKPTSNEVCTLTPSGHCLDMSMYNASLDYRRSGPVGYWPPHYNYFPSTNTTYCAHDDSRCASCRSTTFTNWGSNPSVYCIGANDCVCVAICESSNWESLIQTPLEEELSRQEANGNLTGCAVDKIEDTAADSGSAADEIFIGLPETKMTFANSDPCMWYQNQTFCGAPRTCYDCLNMGLYNGERCMVHSSGYCTSMSAYRLSRDFRRHFASNTTSMLFPSTNTTYCEANDPVCGECRATTFKEWQNATSPPAYCLGNDNCVCIASCESPNWQETVVNLTCDPPVTTRSTKNQLASISTIVTIVVGCVVTSFFALVLLSCFRRSRQRRSGLPGNARRRDPEGPQLELSGWKAMREELINKERDFVAEDSRLTRSSRRPSEGEGQSTDAPAVMVEEGDAYRPASPSRMHQ